MDRGQANRDLARAESLATEMRDEGRWYGLYVVALGGVAAGLTLALGFTPDSVALRTVATVIMTFCLVAMAVYASTRPVVPRRHLTVHMVLAGTGAGVFAAIVVFGTAFHPEALYWWVPGALLTGLPFFLAAYLNLRATRREAK